MRRARAGPNEAAAGRKAEKSSRHTPQASQSHPFYRVWQLIGRDKPYSTSQPEPSGEHRDRAVPQPLQQLKS
ncbi:hypothetical protein VTG60DRAFT_4657 [Thermothelomyces hinnuleus]